MRLKVTHTLDDLETDLKGIAAKSRTQLRGDVRDGIKVGKDLSRGFAKAKAGPHGKNFYKRINAEMNRGLGLFGNTISGEFGPDGSPKSEFVGAGFRSGTNNDLARAADIVGPALLRSVDDTIRDMFREAGFR